MNKEVIIEMLDNKLLIMEELKQVQASIFNGEVKTIMLFIENQQQELERYKNIVDELEKYLKEENKFDEYKDITYRETIGYVLDKLKELKGE